MLFSFVMSLVVAATLIQVAGFATTIYLHRTATHRALTLHPAVEWLFKFALWLTTGQRTKEWVAVHRKHHAFTDEEGDPHSPRLEGFWHVQLGNVFYYVREIKNTDVVERYARDIKEAWWDTHVFNHGFLGIGFGTTTLCVVVGSMIGVWWALLAAGIHAVMYVFVLTSSINGLCHHAGYKNFDNTAFNLGGILGRILSFFTAGETNHNNHHGHQMSPKFSFKRGEFDPAWPVIRFLVRLGLAERDRTIEERLASET